MKKLLITLFLFLVMAQSVWASSFGESSSSATGYQFANHLLACSGPFASPVGGGNVNSFTAYLSQDGGGAGTCVFGVYSNSSSLPNTKLYGGTATVNVPSSAGFVSSSGENYTLPSSSTQVWLCEICSNLSNEVYYFGAAGANFAYSTATYPTWPTTYSGAGTTTGFPIIAANYTTSNGSGRILKNAVINNANLN